MTIIGWLLKIKTNVLVNLTEDSVPCLVFAHVSLPIGELEIKSFNLSFCKKIVFPNLYPLIYVTQTKSISTDIL